MSAPCSRCDCADFKGEPAAAFCLACWHPRAAHHLLVCPECGATIEPVRIPLEAAAIGEGWAGRLPEPVVAGQQALWESTAAPESALLGVDDDTPVTPIALPAAVSPAEDLPAAGGEGGEEVAAPGEEPANGPPSAPEPLPKRARLRLRRGRRP